MSPGAAARATLRATPDVTILTGATGWLGSALLNALARPEGEWHRTGEIRPFVRDRVEAEALGALGAHVRPVIGDLRDDAELDRLFAGAAGTVDVIHTAGVIHPTRVAEFFEVNTAGTRAMLARAGGGAVRRFVHVSSNSPFGVNAHPDDRFRNEEPYNPYYGYGRSKMEAELAVLDAVGAGLDAVIVRPPWFYGPHQPPRQTAFFTMVRKGLFPVFGGGRQARSMVYVDNLVQGVVLAELVATPPGHGWWIADRRPYTVTEIVETVGRALRDEGIDVRPNRAKVPDLVAVVAERADALIQRTGRYHQQLHVLGEMNKNIACDISVACDELGYDPQVELYEGMRRSIRWCLEQGLEL
jgi:nucleoside-diphosphate-sugar epimerase